MDSTHLPVPRIAEVGPHDDQETKPEGEYLVGIWHTYKAQLLTICTLAGTHRESVGSKSSLDSELGGRAALKRDIAALRLGLRSRASG